MKTKLQILALLACSVFSAGCSAGNVPGAGDIEPGLKEFWATCTVDGKSPFNITDVKKTNGINRGGFYEVFFSYKVTLLTDFQRYTTKECLTMATMMAMFAPNVDKALSHRKGFVFSVNDSINMIESENGWVAQ